MLAKHAAKAVRRAAAVPTVQVRRMGGGAHAHAGPAKTLPPRPPLSPNAGLQEKIAHQMWYKRNPDYEGVESYVRYYLPHNHNIVYAILGLYAGLAAWAISSGNKKSHAALLAMPKPTRPDYTSPIPAASGMPEFGTAEWEKFIEGEGNMEKCFEELGK